MNKKNISCNLKQKVINIIAAIDLNYILAEAKREQYSVNLICGDLKNHIKWSSTSCSLSYNYEISTGMVFQFISVHKDKIIKINVSSDDIYPLNRNIIMYVPYEIDLEKVKSEYRSVVDLA